MDRLCVTRLSNDIVEYEVLDRTQSYLLNATILSSTFFGVTAYLLSCTSRFTIGLSLLVWSVLYTFAALTHPLSQSVSIIPPHGIQLSSRTVLGRRVDTFLPSHSISDIVINEGFYRFNIRYYLAIIVRSAASGERAHIVTPLSDVQPTFGILQELYQVTREALLEDVSPQSSRK